MEHQNKVVFAGECKYHAKLVDTPVNFVLHEQVQDSAEIQTAFKDYKFIFGVFSKSGFWNRLLKIPIYFCLTRIKS